MTKSRLVLGLNLICWGSRASFLDQSRSKVKQKQTIPGYIGQLIENWSKGNSLRFHEIISNILTKLHVILTAGLFSASNTGSKLIFLPIGDGDNCSGVVGSKRFMISSKFLEKNKKMTLKHSLSSKMFSEGLWVLLSKFSVNKIISVKVN